MLSQLSYTPLGIESLRDSNRFDKASNSNLSRLPKVGVPEFESGTSSLSATRSNQLSYTPLVRLVPRVASPLPHWLLVEGSGKVYGNSIACQRGRNPLLRRESPISLTQPATLRFAFALSIVRIFAFGQPQRSAGSAGIPLEISREYAF
jgi:hypothetical protein